MYYSNNIILYISGTTGTFDQKSEFSEERKNLSYLEAKYQTQV